MSAVAFSADPELAVADEIARSERELAQLLHRDERMHRSNIEHEAKHCLVCFMG